MILNMNGGADKAQIIDFTLSRDCDLSGLDFLSISGIKFKDGIHGFFIQPTGTPDTTAYSVSWIYSERYSSPVTEGHLYCVFPNTNPNWDYVVSKNYNSNAFMYIPQYGEIQISSITSDNFMKAGSYQLVIW